MAKRLICVIISVLMIVSLLPTGAFATGDPGDSTPVASVAEVNETEENLAESEEQQTKTVEETVTAVAALADTGSSVFPSGGSLSSQTYTLTGNETLETITVGEDVTATIDLAGKTLSANITVTGGSLTITDSTATDNVAGSGGTVVGNITATDGKLTIEAGNYTGTLTGGENKATVEFGTFSGKITAAETVIGYADSGYYCYYQNSDGTYTYTKTVRNESVTIDDETTYYTDFDDALAAANVANQTATLTVLDNSGFTGVTSISITSGISVVGDLTINFNNCNISTSVTTDYIFNVSSGASLTLLNNETSALGNSSATSTSNGGIAVYVDGGALTLGNSCKLAGYYGVKVGNSGTVTVKSGATVTGANTGIYADNATVNVYGDVSGSSYGIYATGSTVNVVSGGTVNYSFTSTYGIYADNSSVNVTGTDASVDGTTYGIYATNNSTVSNTSGAIIGYYSHPTYGIYVENSTVSAVYHVLASQYGIYLKNSVFTSDGGFSVIEGRSVAAIYADASTVTITNAGVSEVASTSYCLQATNSSSVKIDSGWFNGSTSTCLSEDTTSTISVSGGKFSSDVTTYCVSGYTSEYNSETEEYLISESTGTYVAQNLTTNGKYETLQAAIDEASSGDEIKLLANVTENITIASDDDVTIDLNGYTITRAIGTGDLNRIDSPIVTVNGILVLKDSSAEGTGKVYMCTYTDGYDSVHHRGSGNGGIVLVSSTGNFTLDSGTLTSDGEYMDAEGGGVYVTSGGTFTMNGGSITGLKIQGSNIDGGGVYNAGTFIMNGGSITGNASNTSEGGGVYNASGATFTMTAGTISNNSANDFGGGVSNHGMFNLSGGTITSNTASSGGGVIHYSDAILNLSGSPVVSGNNSSNIRLDSGAVITLTSALSSTASIGVSVADTPVEDTPVQITSAEVETTYYESSATNFVPDNTDYVILTSASGYLQIGYEVKTYVAQLYDVTMDDWHEKFVSVQDAIDKVNNQWINTVVLLMDVEEDVTISSTQSVILDLAGHTLTGDVTVEGGTLEIKDSVGNGKIEGDVTVSWTCNYGYDEYGEVDISKDHSCDVGNLTISGGTITGQVKVLSSNLIINDGSIIKGGVYVHDKEDSWGVGMYNASNVTMNGGTISGNSGSGVYISGYNDNATFTMNGGTITGNTATGAGGGVYVNYYASFVMVGGAIYGNSASYAADIYVVEGSTLTIIDASGMKATDVDFTGYSWYLDEQYDRFDEESNTTDTVSAGTYSGQELSLIAANISFILGGSSNAETSVPAEIVSGLDSDTLIVKVSADDISNFSNDNYPTTTKSYYIDFDDSTHYYIFAGWYQDEACETPYTLMPNTEAYAKFVDSYVLTVKVQLPAGFDEDTDETADIRFISTVDGLDYQSVGFVFEINSKKTTTTSTTVYSSLVATDGVSAYTVDPSKFSSASEYFFAFNITNIKKTGSNYDTIIYVTPYWITADGTTVYGTRRVDISVHNAYLGE